MQGSRLALSTLCFSLLACPVLSGDWPQYRGPERTGVSSDTNLLDTWPAGGPKLLWTYRTTGVGYSGPAIVSDVLYTCGGREGSEFLIALDLKQTPPRELWSVKIGPLFTWKGNSWNEGPNVTPTVHGDAVFALGGFGDLLCVESISGKERWRVNLPRDLDGEVNPIGGGLDEPTPLGWGYSGAPLVDGDHVIVSPGGKQGLLAALDKSSGKVIWRSKSVAEQTSYASPMMVTLDGVKQYVQAINSGIVGIAADDGRLLWNYRRESAYDDVVIATPVIMDNMILATVGFGQGCDLIKVTSSNSVFKVDRILSDKSLQNRDGGVVIVGKHLFGHSENRGWVCKEMSTGKELWAERNKLGRGSVSAAGGRLYCLSEEGVVVLVEASLQGWNEKGRFKLPEASTKRKPSGGVWTHPVIANGRLYLRDQELLYCYELRK